MQFINEHPVRVVVRSDDRDHQGRLVRGGNRRLFAQFQRGGLPPYAFELAKQMYQFRQKPPEQPLENWAAFYDSEADQIRNNWTAAERELIEAHLIARGYDCVEKPKLPTPYPNYDKQRKIAGKRTLEHVTRDITATYETAGFDVGLAIGYETENLNSPEVIEALHALLIPVEGDTEAVIAA